MIDRCSTDLIAPVCATAKGGNPELVRESQRKRYADVSLVDKVIELDAKWRDGEQRPCSASLECLRDTQLCNFLLPTSCIMHHMQAAVSEKTHPAGAQVCVAGCEIVRESSNAAVRELCIPWSSH